MSKINFGFEKIHQDEKENRVVTIQITNSYGKTLCSVNMSPKKQ